MPTLQEIPGQEIPGQEIPGAVDGMTASEVRGRALDPAVPSAKPAVTILVDGQPLDAASIAMTRAEVPASGRSRSAWGFVARPQPPSLRETV